VTTVNPGSPVKMVVSVAGLEKPMFLERVFRFFRF